MRNATQPSPPADNIKVDGETSVFQSESQIAPPPRALRSVNRDPTAHDETKDAEVRFAESAGSSEGA